MDDAELDWSSSWGTGNSNFCLIFHVSTWTKQGQISHPCLDSQNLAFQAQQSYQPAIQCCVNSDKRFVFPDSLVLTLRTVNLDLALSCTEILKIGYPAMWSVSTVQGWQRHNDFCSVVFALDSKAHFHPKSQSSELLNYKKNIQFLKLYYIGQQLPLVSTSAPFLPLLLLFVHSSISLSSQHPFPEQLTCWRATSDVAASLNCVPYLTTGFLSSPWRHTAVSSSPCPLSYARFPHK